MASRRRADVLPDVLRFVLLAALPVPVAASADGGARTIYCCQDASDRTMCADILPSACYGRAYREISPQGHVRRHVAAPLTPEEIARRDAEAQRRKKEEARALKQRRLDQALLATYRSLEDIDERQDRALAGAEQSLRQAREREAELVAERARVVAAGAGGDGARSRDVAARLQALDGELVLLRSVITAKARQIDAIRARFAADRRRYVELIAGGESPR